MNIVAHNLSAMNAQRQFGINTRSKAKSTEKLSSGYKINRAADDAAGLAISEKMRRQIRGLTQGVENTQDGVSLCQVADGALAEVNDMLHRITELSVQAANGTNTEQDREAIQEEISEILQEINRIGETTTFNEQKIFGGGFAKATYLPITAGKLEISGTPTDKTGMSYQISADTNGFSINGNNFAWSEFTKGTDTLADSPISGGTYSFDYHGLTLSLTAENDAKIEDFVGRLNGASFATGRPTALSTDLFMVSNGGGGTIITNAPIPAGTKFVLNVEQGGYWISGNGIDLPKITDNFVYTGADLRLFDYKHPDVLGTPSDNFTFNLDASNIKYSPNVTGLWNQGMEMDDLTEDMFIKSFDGAEFTYKLNYIEEHSDTVAKKLYIYEVTGMKLSKTNVAIGTDAVLTDVQQTTYKGVKVPPTQADIDTAPLNLWIQSGCETGQGMWLEIDRMNTNILGINDLDASTVEGANHAMDAVKGALQKVTANRSKIGAQQNRLEHTIANEENVVENTTAAESRIRDTDMAKEMVRFSNINILEQVGHAMMAQANQSNQGVLSLLQ